MKGLEGLEISKQFFFFLLCIAPLHRWRDWNGYHVSCGGGGVHLIVFTLFVQKIDEAFSQRKSKKVSVASPQTFLIFEQTSLDIL